MKKKIGVGIITCNRVNLFSACIKSVPDVGPIIVVNDGLKYTENMYPGNIKEVIQHKRNKGVGRSKNEALEYLMKQDCTDIFLIEDDVKIINENVFDEYIIAAETSGIFHFNFAYHGPANKDFNGMPNPRKVYKYKNGISIGFHKLLGAAFSYFKREVIEKVGYFNPIYKNANEHVAHTFQIIKAQYHTPFWWFADIQNSHLLIEDLDPDLRGSIIRKNKKILDLRIRIYSHLFRLQNGCYIGDIPEVNEAELESNLKELAYKHGNIKYL